MLGFFYPTCYLSDLFLSDSREPHQMDLDALLRKLIDVWYSRHYLILHQEIDKAFSYPLDVHAILAYEMLDLLLGLGRAIGILAIVMDIYMRDRSVA